MNRTEKHVFVVLLIIDAIAIVVGMVSGPMEADLISKSASICAVLISIALLAYGLYYWRKLRQR